MSTAARITRTSARTKTAPASADVKPEVKVESEDVKPQVTHTPPKKRRKGATQKRNEDEKPTVETGYMDTPSRVKAPVTPSVKQDPVTPKTESSKKTTKYKLMPGQTPFPDWLAPTPEQCLDVVQRLESWHGKKEAPKVIPTPSLENSGCGEVPSILDALIRTLLSAATNRRNSSAAFRNIVEKYGILEQGIGEGSVNWDAVRQGSEAELFEAIKCGGLAKNKSKNIKAILDMVYEENLHRAAAVQQGGDNAPQSAKVPGEDQESKNDKLVEIERSKQHVLSLDHLHSYEKNAAMEALLRFPGVGVKTSSCTILFCLSRPSFAVDTHVHRLCSWLGWIPPKATRDQAFFHLDTKIPDEHKYALHVLMWQHGVACPSCRLIPVKERREFDGMECPLADLIKANGGWKSTASGGTPAKGKAQSKKVKASGGKKEKGRGKGKRVRDETTEEEDEASESDSELSDMH
ncbi:hypothetical protein QFC22_002245 [Naganishia vaughanmartiniae]|uniref:Uncharacterized protein n=1 Tax=Naganishia vaughanmartiniae TaxID=1424756 RepID=A0ACC2XDD7_9TREE|nr:hypothetical protein QFC22_002245 [Naganishia vaughanmartiniae]